MTPMWLVAGKPASPELIAILCDGDQPTRELLGAQVVIK